MGRLPRIVEYEHRTEPLLSRAAFLRRMANHGIVSLIVVAGSLGLGVLGYHFLEGLPWLDALLNASMILGGEGPVDRLQTVAGKWFASGYAIFSGVIFLVAVSFLIAPLAHRLLHRLHLDQGADRERDSKRG